MYFHSYFVKAEFQHPNGKNLLCDFIGTKCWFSSFSNSTKHSNCQNCLSDCDQIVYDYSIITEKSNAMDCQKSYNSDVFLHEYFSEYETESKMEEFISNTIL